MGFLSMLRHCTKRNMVSLGRSFDQSAGVYKLHVNLRMNGQNVNLALELNLGIVNVILQLMNPFLINLVFSVPAMDIKENFAPVRGKISFEIVLL